MPFPLETDQCLATENPLAEAMAAARSTEESNPWVGATPLSTPTPSPTCPNQGDKVLEDLVSLILGEGIVRRGKFCTWAARNNKEHLLKYLMAQGYAYGASTCEAVARNGNVELLKYLRDNNCHWTSSTTRAAAQACQLATLSFAVENGCRWVQQEDEWVSEEGEESQQ